MPTDLTQDQLAALDRAATQGVWESHEVKGQAGWSQISAPGNACVAVEIGDEDGPFVCALVNLYRTGKLVLIDDGAVERAGFAIWHKLGQIESNVRAGQLTEDEVREIATAAIAALGVK